MSENLGESSSLCPECLKVIPAVKYAENDNVYLEKTCPEHGKYKVLIWRGVADYKAMKAYACVPSKPEKYAVTTKATCPVDCGLCQDHTQHTCLVVLEITNDCNLKCPICFASANERYHFNPTMQGTPLIRYRTRDLSFLIEPPCHCDFVTIGRMGKVQGRMDAQTKIGYGQKIFPVLFDEVLLSIHGVLGYHLLLEREGYRDKLTFTVEMKGDQAGAKEKILEALMQLDEIKEPLENDLILPLVIELVEAGSVPFAPKSKVIEDRRKNYDATPAKGS